MNSRSSLQQFKGFFFAKGIFALLLATPEVANAAIDIKDTNYPIPIGAYFVSPNGKDGNSGKTPDEPWSVEKAIKSAPRGATIVFKGGTYRNIKANINKQLTLQAYPHSKPWLKGSVVVKGWVKDGGIWRKDGWKYSFPSNMGRQYIDPKYPMAGYRDMVYINGVSLKQVGSKAGVKPGTFYLDAALNRLYIGNNPAGKTVESTALSEAFTMWKSSNASGTVIRGLGFAHYADRALQVGAPNVTLENNIFKWNGVGGVLFGDGRGSATDAIVRGNTFSYNGRKGLGGEADRILVEGNTISYNNVENFRKAWDAAGAKFSWTNGLLFRNNIVRYNKATGIWLDNSTTNATVVNNTVRSNTGIGIQLELSHLAIIAANLVNHNGTGIMIADSSNARVYNNTLSMNQKHIAVKDSTRKNTKAAEIAAGNTWVTRDNVFKNNILSNTSTTAVLFDASDCGTNQHSKLMITAADYNAYYRNSSSQHPNLFKWSLDVGKCSVKYKSFAAFKSATGFESNGLEMTNVATNPFFVDAASGDYRLKPGSPAIGRGASLPVDIAKAIGVPEGVRVDLGALQSKTVLIN